ncbi:thialysine N-epsilon-acetyltransferase isoform X1 [Entelurus aequoreus]|uniref:thialysine N-epsilon-acetyltransferase isoform X1 n=1 Tax=Entelurus aequoreus TaxID=161455 RepID=UPI002B1D8F54|nr:thialysine N-epsilon-acetyltransferase isoform X1 [Entelurus aequoreus]
MDFSIRAANVEDCKDVARMNLDLAAYENVPEQCVPHKFCDLDLEQDGFSKNPFFQCLIAEVPQQHKSKDGYTSIGFALYFYSYSAWKGRSIYMEDLYVMPEFRGQGVGKALLSKVAQRGLASGCNMLNFTVLHANQSSVDLYLRRGGLDLTSDVGYHYMAFEEDALQQLART